MKLDLNITKRLHGPEGNMLLDVALTVESGEVMAIYGPSGAGKTTLLRLVAGLDRPDSGFIHADNLAWYASKIRVDVPARQRKAGMVFQDYALFPNMSVRRHLQFAQPSPKPDKIDELLQLTGLSQLADRKPRQLSGGQQQRLALARALAAEPQLLLLDEALSALDPDMRQQMQQAVLDAQREFGLTIVLVSHDPGEVFRLANQVAVLEGGKITKLGSPREVFASVSDSNGLLIPAQVLEINQEGNRNAVVLKAQGQIHTVIRDDVGEWAAGKMVWLEFDPQTGQIKS